MNDKQLITAMNDLTRGCGRALSPPLFWGVYFDSDLEKIIHEIKWRLHHHQKCYLIINVRGGYNLQMGHWISLYADTIHTRMYFLDSLANNYGFYGDELKNFIAGLKPNVVHRLRYRLQAENSLTCGLYSLYFAREIMLHGVRNTLSHLFDFFFTNKRLLNDTKVIRYCYSYLPMPDCQKILCDLVSQHECLRNICHGL